MDVFSRMAGVELTDFPGSVEDRQAEQTAMIGLAGALCGMDTIVVRLPLPENSLNSCSAPIRRPLRLLWATL
jgi:hypothetical protein